MIHVRGDIKEGGLQMSFKNYSKFSGQNKKFNHEEMVVKNEEAVQAVHDEIINEIVTGVTTETGVVNCKRLNVREKASVSAKILCVINENEEVTIHHTETESAEFYRVSTSSGIEGFCMRKFITVK